MQYNDPQSGKLVFVSGDVIVTRSPSLHPGDIRRVRACSPEEVPGLAHLCDVVVFSQKGFVPLPHLLAGGDLDGDTFLVNLDRRFDYKKVSWDERLLISESFGAMDYTPAVTGNIKVDCLIESKTDASTV